MSNSVSCILSHHGPSPSYRLMLTNGQLATKTKAEVRCMVRGELALSEYDPYAPLDCERSEPVSAEEGPRKGDILLVRIDQCRAACEVLAVETRKGRPLYLVKYDDGMFVKDHLMVPWNYLSTALDAAESVSATDVESASASSLAAAPLSEVALSKE